MSAVKKQISIRELLGSSFLESLRPVSAVSTADWATASINFSLDATHAGRGSLRLRPYQIPVLDAADLASTREITVCAPPQTGKSLAWKLILAKRLYDGGVSALVVYPNDDLASSTNRDTLLPLLRSVPKLKADMDKPHSKSIDSYHLTDSAAVLYFQGAGSAIISKSAGLTIADELDQWFLPGTGQGATAEEGRNVDNLVNLRARSATFPDRLCIKCSTPTVPGAQIWKEYQHSSRGVFNIVCLHCGQLLPSNRIAYRQPDGSYCGLQWQKDIDKGVLPDTIRFVCPTCKNSHYFADASAMVNGGKYVHEHPERTWHMGYQWGCLVAPEVPEYSWLNIAEAQEDASPANLQGRKRMKNYFLALPYSASADAPKDEGQNAIQSHCKPAPKDSDIACVFGAIDVQGGQDANYFVYTIRGYAEGGNSYLLKHGICQNMDQLSAIADGTYAGQKVLFGLVDHGGFDHDRSGLTQWVLSRPHWYYYKGDSQALKTQANGWEVSKTARKLILCNPGLFQTQLLDRIYTHRTDTGENFWTLPADIDDDYLRQIRSVQPSTRSQNGEAYANWKPQGGERHDYFDVEKQLMACCAIAESALIAPSAFRHGTKPLFIRKSILMKLKRQTGTPQKL